jgi:hypothetical protein
MAASSRIATAAKVRTPGNAAVSPCALLRGLPALVEIA